MLPPIGSWLIPQTVISARNWLLGVTFGVFTLRVAAARYSCYMIFTGKYGNIDFNMKITFCR